MQNEVQTRGSGHMQEGPGNCLNFKLRYEASKINSNRSFLKKWRERIGPKRREVEKDWSE